MKRILGLVLVLALAMSFIPASFAAAPAQKSMTNTVDVQMADKTVDPTGMAKDFNTRSDTNLNGVPEEWRSINVNETNPMVSWQEATGWLVPVIEDSQTWSNGYVMDYSAGDFDVVDDVSDVPAYGTWLIPCYDDGSYTFDEGEGIFMTMPVYQSYTQSGDGVEFTPYDYDVEVEAWLFMGYEQGDGTIYLTKRFYGTNGINVNYMFPDDGMFAQVLLLVYDNSGSCISFVTPGMYENMYNTMTADPEAVLQVGDTVDIDLSASDMYLNSEYMLTSGRLFSVEMEADQMLTAQIDGDGSGLQMIFMDHNMDMIGTTWASPYAFEGGEYTYADFDLPMWAPVAGTYYLLVGGFYYEDTGELSVTLSDEDTVGMGAVEADIDISDLGTESVETDSYIYEYTDGIGTLSLAYFGAIYNITGENPIVSIDVYDWTTVNFENVSINSLWMANSMGQTIVNCVGENYIGYEDVEYKVYAYPGSTSGLILAGENLTIEGMFGIVLDGVSLGIYTESLTFDITPPEGYYPIATWVQNAHITLGDNPTSDPEGIVLTTVYWQSIDFETEVFCYTFSEYDELYYFSDPGAELAATEFTLMTDGLASGPDGVLGDVNGNGNVDTGDAATVLRFSVGLVELNDNQMLLADYNQDSTVNTGDAAAILKATVGA